MNYNNISINKEKMQKILAMVEYEKLEIINEAIPLV